MKSEWPHSREAEEYLLSCCLQSQESIDVAADHITKDDFYIPSNGQLFDLMLGMRMSGEAVDLGTVGAKWGDRPFLHYLLSLDVLFSHTKDYAASVANLSLRRRIIKAGRQIAEKGIEESDGMAALDASESLLCAARGGVASDGPTPIRELLRAAQERVDAAAEGKANYGLRTHLARLNEVIIGLAPGGFHILAARPAQGKTSLGLEIARHIAEEHRVLFFSGEMTRDELVDRMLAAASHVPLTNLRAGRLTPQERDKLHDAVASLSTLSLSIDDSSTSMLEVQRRIRRAASRAPIGLVVIDYIQLLSLGRGKSHESRQQEVAQISRLMKLTAREFAVPVLALSQLSRPERKFDADNTKPKKPTLASLRESGALEQDADQVWFLYRANEESPEVELIVAKNRNGPTGKVMLHFVPHTTTFIEL